jgi:hypothetical protein
MPRKGQKLGARVKPMTLHELVNEVRRSAEVLADGERLIRFAVEVEHAIYDGRIAFDAIPRDLLMLLVQPKEAVTL